MIKTSTTVFFLIHLLPIIILILVLSSTLSLSHGKVQMVSIHSALTKELLDEKQSTTV